MVIFINDNIFDITNIQWLHNDIIGINVSINKKTLTRTVSN